MHETVVLRMHAVESKSNPSVLHSKRGIKNGISVTKSTSGVTRTSGREGPNMVLKPASCKNKGRRLQQKVVRSILDAFPHLQSDDCFSTSMGANGEDVRMSPLARSAVPLSIECKCVEKISIWSCIEQAKDNSPQGTTPCVIFTRNRAPTYAVVPWDFLLLLLVRANQSGGLPADMEHVLRELLPLLARQFPTTAPISPPPRRRPGKTRRKTRRKMMTWIHRMKMWSECVCVCRVVCEFSGCPSSSCPPSAPPASHGANASPRCPCSRHSASCPCSYPWRLALQSFPFRMIWTLPCVIVGCYDHA